MELGYEAIKIIILNKEKKFTIKFQIGSSLETQNNSFPTIRCIFQTASHPPSSTPKYQLKIFRVFIIWLMNIFHNAQSLFLNFSFVSNFIFQQSRSMWLLIFFYRVTKVKLSKCCIERICEWKVQIKNKKDEEIQANE